MLTQAVVTASDQMRFIVFATYRFLFSEKLFFIALITDMKQILFSIVLGKISAVLLILMK